MKAEGRAWKVTGDMGMGRLQGTRWTGRLAAGIAALLALAILGGRAAPARADPAPDRILERAVLEDPDGMLTIAQVVTRPFAPAAPLLARGYTPAAHWLRLTVGPDTGEPLVLRIRPSYLDRIELYAPDPDAPDGWRRQVTGDRIPFLERKHPSVTLGFAIWPSGSATTYYLRLSTTSTSLMHVEVLTPQEAALRDLRIDVSEIFILSLLLYVLLWTASDFVARRDPVVGCFAINQIFFISYNVLIMGYGALIFPDAGPGFVDMLTSVMVIATPLFSLLTNRLLLRQFDLHPLARWMMDALIALNITAFGLLAFGATQQALSLNALVVVLIVPLLPILALGARREAPPGRRILWVVYLIQTLPLALTILPLLGVLPATTWNLNANIIHGLLSDLPMFALLALRSRAARRLGLEAQMHLDMTRRELELQRAQMEMQNRFMAMLTHELRTPLSVIRMAVGTAKVEGEPRRLIDSAFANMAGIIDRCSFAGRMEQNGLDVALAPVDVPALIAAIVAACGEPARVAVNIAPLPPLLSDQQLLGVVIHNLVENALKYSPEGSAIHVRAARDDRADAGPGLRISVENACGRTGTPDAAKVFEKFYRGPHARMKSGSGLGLYIVHGIAALLGGSATYEPAEGRARFSVWLPC